MTDQEILYSLAATVQESRAQLDAMSVLLGSTMAFLAQEPATLARFAMTVQAQINEDEAISLGSQMNDDMLRKRAAWLRRLMPPHLLQQLRLP